MTNSTPHNRGEKKIQELKKITELYLGKENTDVGTEKERYMHEFIHCEDEDTPENQVE